MNQAMPITRENSDGSWLFVTTSPTCNRPSKAQRSQVKRRVMRDIGLSRRKKAHESRALQEGEKGHDAPEQMIEPSGYNMNQYEGKDYVGGSLYTFIPSPLNTGLGYPTPLENNARLILSHSKCLFTPSNPNPHLTFAKCFPSSSPRTSASTATNGFRLQSATHRLLTRC